MRLNDYWFNYLLILIGIMILYRTLTSLTLLN